MKKYELFTIVRPNLDMEEVDKAVKGLEDTIKNYGGNALNVDKMGRKRLAYEVQGFKDGFHVTIDLELPENKVADLKRYLKLNENFIRELLVVEEKAKAAAK